MSDAIRSRRPRIERAAGRRPKNERPRNGQGATYDFKSVAAQQRQGK
jgi:hypothetical protein